jgi:dihydroorotate dehydrogenase
VTPLSQPGNAKPRMFRLEEDRAIINRMGFNSGGLENFLNNFNAGNTGNASNRAISGINIGKNKITSNEDANDDYLKALRAVYDKADYVTVNISSPNTESLRELQGEEPLTKLLQELSTEREKLTLQYNVRKPIALKIAPDLNSEEIKVIANLLIKNNFDALIATNTTITRASSLKSGHQNEVGGLSGAVLKHDSTKVIAEFYSHLKGKVPIIGVGGIENSEDAWQKMLAGADYVQIYSGLIYHGPEMIRDIVKGLKVKSSKHSSLAEALASERK